MSPSRLTSIEQRITTLYEAESGRVLATLLRLLHGNFDLAEEAMQDAFIAALTQWQMEGIPDNPRAWLVSTGRFKAIDRLRKQSRLNSHLQQLALTLEHEWQSEPQPDNQDSGTTIEDDRLRLIFTCCHPALAQEARLALTLREVCGLTTEAIAAAFLVPVPTLAQRIVRAKNKIRDAAIPYELPEPQELASRLESVLSVIYLVFNEGYSASSGVQLIKHDLAQEAIRLARLLHDLLPDAEVTGLLALMLLHDARRASRTTGSGDLIPLEAQNRALWNREQIREGCELVVMALNSAPPGRYAIQAAIAALHAEAASPAETNWAEITGFYNLLLQLSPSPIVELNRAAAVAMRDGPEAGLNIIDSLIARGELLHYHLLHAARADLLRRLDRTEEALHSYRQALDLAQQEPERRFLQQRLVEVQK